MTNADEEAGPAASFLREIKDTYAEVRMRREPWQELKIKRGRRRWFGVHHSVVFLREETRKTESHSGQLR